MWRLYAHPPDVQPVSTTEAAMLADILYFSGGLAAFALIAAGVAAAGRL